MDRKLLWKLLTITTMMLMLVQLTPLGAITHSNNKLTPNLTEKQLVYASPFAIGTENSIWVQKSSLMDQVSSAVYNGLLKRYAPSNEIGPDLATSLPSISSDSLTYTFTLQSGLLFDDGTQLTSDDVIFSYQLHLTASIDQSDNGYSFLSKFMTNTSIAKTGDEIVIFKLTQPYAFYSRLFSVPIVSQSHWQAKYDQCIVDSNNCNWNALDGSDLVGGAGPFMVDIYDTSTNLVELVPNPNYYSTVKLDRIIFKTISSYSDAIPLLNAGEVHILDSYYRIASYYGFDDTIIDESFIGSHTHEELAINHLHPFIGSGEYSTVGGFARSDFSASVNATAAKNIRNAMSHAVDRGANHEIPLDLVLFRSTATSMPKTALGYDETLLPRSYDISLARTFMEAAGFDYSGGTFDPVTDVFSDPFFDLKLIVSNEDSVHDTMAQLYIPELAKIGINITTYEIVDPSILSNRIYQSAGAPPTYDEGGYDIFINSVQWDLDWDPYTYYDSTSLLPEGRNIYNYHNSTVDLALTDYATEIDENNRILNVISLQQMIFDEQPSIALFHSAAHWLSRLEVTGLEPLLLSIKMQEWEKVDTTFILILTDTNSDGNTGTSSTSASDATSTSESTSPTGQSATTKPTTTETSNVSFHSVLYSFVFIAFFTLLRKRGNKD